MAAKKKATKKKTVKKKIVSMSAQSDAYQHQDDAVQRPDVGVQPEFENSKRPKKYRYDSSLAPELCWDENAEREFVEWLLNLIGEAAGKGEEVVFETPQVWKGTDEKFSSLSECVARLKSLTQPFLNWSGKAERQQISVPTIPLFVHERHSTQAILKTLESYKTIGTNLDLFGDPGLDVTDKLDAYEHKGPWSNRLILGDSLQIMNSLLEYEGLGGQIQMVFIDPPYGIKFGSNFQPFVKNNKVAHGRDDEMIREPEMVKAYRDTWELGLHSYLTYLRDRAVVAKELINQSGSIFVQISASNVHHVREIMDEIFGSDNFISQITFRKKLMPLGSKTLESMSDYLVWYAKDKGRIKYNQLYKRTKPDPSGRWTGVKTANGEMRRLTSEERADFSRIPGDAKLFGTVSQWAPSYSENNDYEFEFEGIKFKPTGGQCWVTSKEKMEKLASQGRLFVEGKYPRYVSFHDDFPYAKLTNPWDDTAPAQNKSYVVQTNIEVVARCIHMATAPGDLVLDITCGSGTTAYTAEKWGRRWITCDTSRVPIALARQRLLTSIFPWYELKSPLAGPSGGFKYTRKQNRKGEEVGGIAPRISLKTLANDEDPQSIVLVDKPEEIKHITRVCGPFTVEATIDAASTMLFEQGELLEEFSYLDNPRVYIDRMIEVLRQSKTLQLPGNKSLEFANVRPLSAEDHEYLHADAIENNGASKRIAVVFGPEEGAINSNDVLEAAREAYFHKFDALYFFGFAIQAKARELVEDRKKLKLPCAYITVTPDVVMSDLLKTSKSSEIFSITGLPDIRFNKSKGKSPSNEALYEVELLGLDIFRPHDMETESIEAVNLPCWMLDTDYNNMSFCARQVFFPKTSAWDNLQKSLKGQFNDSAWEHLAGTISEPFLLGKYKRIAVKVIDERGNELLVVRDAEEAE